MSDEKVSSNERLSDANLEYHAKSGTYDIASMAQELLERRKADETKPQARDAEHCDYPDCEQHWTNVVAQARAILEPLAEHDPAIRRWLSIPDLPRLPSSVKASDELGHRWEQSPTQPGKEWCPRCGCPRNSIYAAHKCNPSRDSGQNGTVKPWPWPMCKGCGNEPNACTCPEGT